MALNFRIERQRKSGYLYLRLTGDFDGASALELIRELERKSTASKKIFIDTRGLSSILNFGQDVFVKHCAISQITSRNLVFCGLNGDRIRPKGAALMSMPESHMTN